MERRVTSHTEEEEMNQRRRLLTLARKGDQKATDLLFELYQVRVFSGDALKRKKLPSFPVEKPSSATGKGTTKKSKKKETASQLEPAAPKEKVRGVTIPPATKKEPQAHKKTTKKGVGAKKAKGKVKKISLPVKKTTTEGRTAKKITSSVKGKITSKVVPLKKPRIAKKK